MSASFGLRIHYRQEAKASEGISPRMSENTVSAFWFYWIIRSKSVLNQQGLFLISLY
jgi:hypothetical protein